MAEMGLVEVVIDDVVLMITSIVAVCHQQRTFMIVDVL
jgi:hypothetical protein